MILPARLCLSATVFILHSWCSTLDQSGSVRALFVDFTKAFDRVDHNILFTKLKDRGIPHCLVKWFHSYLRLRRQTVRVDNQYSDWLYITAGMPQGSPPGPTFLSPTNWWPYWWLPHPYWQTVPRPRRGRGTVCSTDQGRLVAAVFSTADKGPSVSAVVQLTSDYCTIVFF